MILQIIKIALAIAGLLAASFFLLIGLTNKSRSYVRTGWMILLATVGIIAAIIGVEFLVLNVY